MPDTRSRLTACLAALAEEFGADTVAAAATHTAIPAGYVSVTVFTGQRRHLARPGGSETLCHAAAVGPGDIYRDDVAAPMTQTRINRMDLCRVCARTANRNPTQGSTP